MPNNMANSRLQAQAGRHRGSTTTTRHMIPLVFLSSHGELRIYPSWGSSLLFFRSFSPSYAALCSPLSFFGYKPLIVQRSTHRWLLQDRVALRRHVRKDASLCLSC